MTTNIAIAVIIIVVLTCLVIWDVRCRRQYKSSQKELPPLPYDPVDRAAAKREAHRRRQEDDERFMKEYDIRLHDLNEDDDRKYANRIRKRD